jgi:cullin-associated NEDD8-dissociated protein 1
LLKDKHPALRAITVQSIRYALPDSGDAFDIVLKDYLVDMLNVMLSDPEMDIRRLAMTALNSAAHNKPEMILSHLSQLMPYVLAESKVKPELIREVQMGPFKHFVDDGLEVRKVRDFAIAICTLA